MSFFKERNQLRVEYSGFQEVSDSLRRRLFLACRVTVFTSAILQKSLEMHIGTDSFGEILGGGDYDDVFEAVELFLHHSHEHSYESPEPYTKLISDVITAFDLSGSVYSVRWDSRQINLRVDERTARGIEEAKAILAQNKPASEKFLSAVGNLFGRKQKPADTMGDMFIALEGYLKSETKTTGFGQAIDALMRKQIISATQKALMDKIYASRSDMYGVAHAGNSREPDEVDALWFLETVVAQMKLIDRRLKQSR